MPLRVVVTKQFVGEFLIVADRDRPIRVVLDPQRRVLLVRQADRVVETEQHAIAEATVHGELNRMIGAPADRLLLVDVREAAVEADEVGVRRHVRSGRVS